MPSPIDQRRLRDGARALETTLIPATTIVGAHAQLATIDDGVAALQSLDDLGPEANAQVLRDLRELRKRREAIEERLHQLEQQEQRR